MKENLGNIILVSLEILIILISVSESYISCEWSPSLKNICCQNLYQFGIAFKHWYYQHISGKKVHNHSMNT